MYRNEAVAALGFGVVTLAPWLSWMGWIVAGGAWLLVLRLFYSTRKANLDELRKANREALATIDRMEPIVGKYAAMDRQNTELIGEVDKMKAVNAAQDRTIEFQAQTIDRMEKAQAELMRKVEEQGKMITHLRDTLTIIVQRHPEIPNALLNWDK